MKRAKWDAPRRKSQAMRASQIEAFFAFMNDRDKACIKAIDYHLGRFQKTELASRLHI